MNFILLAYITGFIAFIGLAVITPFLEMAEKYLEHSPAWFIYIMVPLLIGLIIKPGLEGKYADL